MKSVRIHTSGKHFAGSRLNSVVSPCKAGNRVQKDNDIVSALYHPLSLLKHHVGNFHMTLCRLVKSGSYDLSLYAACHIGHLLRTFIDEKDNHIDLRMIVCNCIGN